MNVKHPPDQLIASIVADELPDVLAIYRYGSSGSTYQRADSDIDIAILADHRLSFREINHLSQDLATATGGEIDLHDIRALPVTLRVQIVLDGTRLYGNGKTPVEAYETLVLSEYVRLNEERREILNDIQKRGQIYGKTSAG